LADGYFRFAASTIFWRSAASFASSEEAERVLLAPSAVLLAAVETPVMF
jgi:hypothetical protein